MLFKILPPKTSTILFKLPHISKLFVYKRNLSNNHGMVEIVTEILRYGQLEMIYIGATDGKIFDCNEYLKNCVDCAIIRVNLLDTCLSDIELELTQARFIDELQNTDNFIHMESNIVDKKLNLSCVDLVVNCQKTFKSQKPLRYQAA